MERGDMLILNRLMLLRILLHKKSQKLLYFSFFIIILIIFVFLEKNIINENLAYTFLVTTVSLTKNIKYNHIIKRYTKGGKKIGEKAIEKFGENVTKTTASSCPTSTQNPMPKYYTSQKNDNQSTEKTNTTLISNTSNQPQTNIKKENTASSYSNQASKNNFEDKIKNSSKKSEENNNATEANKLIKNFVKNENENIKNLPKGNIKFQETNFENVNHKGIPTPPPLPKEPLIKPIEKFDISGHITPEILEAAKKNLTNQFQIPLNTQLKDEYNLTDEEVLIEGLARGLLKKDESPTKTEKFITINNEEINTIESQYNIKLTQLGQAHCKEMIKTKMLEHGISNYNESDYEYKLGIMTDPNTDILIPSGKETHIVTVLIFNKKNNETYIMGFLTSKKAGEEISSIQYIDYQRQKENENEVSKITKIQKTQQYQASEHFEWVDKNKIKFLKWGEEYINNTELRDILRLQHDNIYPNLAKIINSGLTKKNIIEICLNFDKKIKNKEPQPKTKEQILQQAKGIEKQKKIQEENTNKKTQIHNKDEDEIFSL